MRNPVSAFRPHTALRVTAVILMAGAAAACSNSSRFGDRLFTGSTANQREIIGSASDQPIPAPISTGRAAVTRSELPPPPTAVAGSYGPPTRLGNPDPTTDGPYAWSAVGGAVITVGRAETLDTIAMKFGVPQAQILSANQLTSAAQVRPGRVLVIPHRVAVAPDAYEYQPATTYGRPAPVAAMEPARPVVQAGATGYVVQSGDTLYSISRRLGTTVDALVAVNGLASPDEIRIGQTLRLPADADAGQAMAYAPTAQTMPTPVAALSPNIRLASPAQTVAAAPPRIVPAPSIPVETTASTPVAVRMAIDDTIDPPSADGTSFRWPVRGRIISAFGTKPNGERNDGINLAVPEGTSVKAVEAGTVIYAGNELEGYGNLVLIRHADGWVSAYAHNNDLVVRRGDSIRRGQTIGHAGMTGSVTSPQVHFELRQGAKPVNPLDHLTG